MLSFHGNFQQQKLMQFFSVSINILIKFNIAFRSLIALNQLCAACMALSFVWASSFIFLQ